LTARQAITTLARPKDYEASMMTVVTINARVNTWTAEISNVESDKSFERHFTVEGNIHRQTRFALGAQLIGFVVSIRRTFEGLRPA
jgi:hypothetical protein